MTGGLRRTADMVRGVLERTRGDLTMALRQQGLERRLGEMEAAVALPPAGEGGSPEQ
jgi:translin